MLSSRPRHACAGPLGDALTDLHLAYLDPGSGSVVVQAILGGAAGIAVAAKLVGRRIKRAAGLAKRDETDVPTSEREEGSAAPDQSE